MQDRPEDIDEGALRSALSAWGFEAACLTHAPVGFGDHHWTAVDARGRRWFVTVADLAEKPHCGIGVEAAVKGLRRAMDTASALGAMDFVVAPLRTTHGETLRRLGERYAISVFLYVAGTPGHVGQARTPRERGLVVDMLAELHQVPPPASSPVLSPVLSTRPQLREALEDLDRPWQGGPFAEPARALTADHAADITDRLREFDTRVDELGKRQPVVTHGEPHPGNVLRLGDRRLLVDWDTVGLAVPERDLWMVAEEPDELARYADATGREPDPSAMDLYRLRWDLEDVAAFVSTFRSRHARTPDTEQAWAGLTGTMERLS